MSNNISVHVLQSLVIYIFVCSLFNCFCLLVTLSGRPGDYPDDLIKKKKEASAPITFLV